MTKKELLLTETSAIIKAALASEQFNDLCRTAAIDVTRQTKDGTSWSSIGFGDLFVAIYYALEKSYDGVKE